MTINNHTNVSFINNTAVRNGGALFLSSQSDLSFKGNFSVLFGNNSATLKGGAMYSISICFINFGKNCGTNFLENTCSIYDEMMSVPTQDKAYSIARYGKVIFNGNTAQQGGAILLIQSNLMVYSYNSARFEFNSAENGGAISILQSILTFYETLRQYLSTTQLTVMEEQYN